MPVLTSMYHSGHIANLFDYYGTPEFQTLSYRWPFFKNYQINRYKKYQHNKALKEILTPKYHHLIDNYDQDHAMILGQGTAGDVYQSIMVKPPNIKPVYPMVKQDTREEIVLDSKFDGKEYIYVFNVGKNTPDSVFYNDPKGLADFVEVKEKDSLESRFSSLNHVIVAEDESQLSALSKNVENRQVVITKDPTNVKVLPRDHKQKFIWVSECTQANFISAFVEHRAPLLGFAPDSNELNTKRFNCHKVIEN